MDECLRVSSGFKGADDIKECRLMDIQQISDCTVSKIIKSAPHFEVEGAGSSQNCTLDITLGASRWIEVIETHLPRGLSHDSAMVFYHLEPVFCILLGYLQSKHSFDFVVYEYLYYWS